MKSKEKKELTPNNLLSTWELKEYVEKYSPENLKSSFNIAFNKIENLTRQKLGISAICVRGNIQLMLDNLNDTNVTEQFKAIYN